MNYENLIERLRNATRLPMLAALCNEAADTIEALTKPVGTWTEKIVLDENGKFDFCSRRFYCSACGVWNSYGKTKNCPECGARMEVQDG